MKKIIFALIAGVTAMTAAQAAQPGPYIGLGVASSDHDFKIGGTSNVDSDGYTASGKIFGGVNITPMFGVEAGYQDVRKADHTFTVGGVPGSATSQGHRAYLAGKATMPVNDRFALYGKLGAGYSKAELTSSTPFISRSDSKTELYGAVGGEYSLSEKVALSLEYERYGKSKDYGVKADTITLGARYNF